MAFGELQAIKTVWRLAGLSTVSGDSSLILSITKRSYFIDIFHNFFLYQSKTRKQNKSHFLLGYFFSDYITRKMALISQVSSHLSLKKKNYSCSYCCKQSSFHLDLFCFLLWFLYSHYFPLLNLQATILMHLCWSCTLIILAHNTKWSILAELEKENPLLHQERSLRKYK